MNILITGAASGIGYDVGIKLANLGYHVFLTTEDDKQLELLREKVKSIDNIGTFRLNLTNKDDIRQLEDFDIDILISNAAIDQGGSILDIQMDKIRECYDVNLFYNIDIIKQTINNMAKKKKGKIIVMRTSIDTCYKRVLDRWKSINENYSKEEYNKYAERKKGMFKWYKSLNNFLEKVERL